MVRRPLRQRATIALEGTKLSVRYDYDASLVYPLTLRPVSLGFYSSVTQAEAKIARALCHDTPDVDTPANVVWSIELMKLPVGRDGHVIEIHHYDGDGNYLGTIQHDPEPEPFVGRDTCKYKIGDIVSLMPKNDDNQKTVDIAIITALPPTSAKAARMNARFAQGPIVFKPEHTGLSVQLAICPPAATDTYQVYIPSTSGTQCCYEFELHPVDAGKIENELATRLRAHSHHLLFWEQCRNAICEGQSGEDVRQFIDRLDATIDSTGVSLHTDSDAHRQWVQENLWGKMQANAAASSPPVPLTLDADDLLQDVNNFD